jgi:hypothetical protein
MRFSYWFQGQVAVKYANDAVIADLNAGSDDVSLAANVTAPRVAVKE